TRGDARRGRRIWSQENGCAERGATGTLFRGRVAGDQGTHAVAQRRVRQRIEQAAATVLATGAVGARQAALLVHVAEDRIVGGAGRRDPDLRVVVVRARPAGQPDFFAVPDSGYGDFHSAGLAGIVPTHDGR